MGNEGAEERPDRDCRISIGGRFFWIETQGCESCHGGVFGYLRQRVEEDGFLQTRPNPQVEAEAQTGDACSEGLNPFTKEPCVFKAKPASQKVRGLALKKLK